MMKQEIAKRRIEAILSLFILFVVAPKLFAQPIVDTVKAIQKQNDRSYRMLDQLEGTGDSYTFTNVIKWKITDPDLQNQIRDAITKDPFGLKKEDFDVVEIYVFSAPVGQDKVEPFHILVRGYIKEKTGKKKKSGGGFGAFDEDVTSAGAMVPKWFQGRNVIRLLHRTNPALLESINTIQGDNVEMPGDIVPHGSQLVKDTKMRYLFSKVFDEFYSRRVVLDEQRRYYGLPTSYDLNDLPAEASAVDSIKSPVDPESTTALPDDPATINRAKAEYYASRSERTIDLSITDLRINASKKLGLELELGNKEVGLPFWTSGVGRFWLNLKNQIGSESNVKLGLVFPLDLGNSDLFTFKARQLSGSFGGSIDAYFAGISFFSGFDLPLAFKFSLMPSGQGTNSSIITNGQQTQVTAIDGTLVTIPAGRTFYREGLIMQLFIPTIVQLDLNNFLQVSVGFGLDNVYQSLIPKGNNYDYTNTLRSGGHPLFTTDQADKVQDLTRVSNAVSPHIEIDYVNHQGSKFGLSAAYDHLFTFGGWIELVEDHFRIEMNYSAPIIRDPKPWEPGSFFLITPRFYF